MWNREGALKRDVDSAVAQPTSSPLPLEERRSVAWVGKSVIFKGTLVSSEAMMIDGHVEGTIEVRDQALVVGPNADIRAEIVAGSVTIHGTVVGNIRATTKVDVRATSRIEGDLIAPRVAIAEGAVVSGRIDTLAEPSDAANPRSHFVIA
jgi:cytoskeletal protein CcmA (bactofilin family)